MFWDDGCKHGEDCFVATVYGLPEDGKREVFDVYVFQDSGGRTELCFRYGHEAEEYLSPGSLSRALQVAALKDPDSTYARAADVARTWVLWEAIDGCRARANGTDDSLFRCLATALEALAPPRPIPPERD